MNKEPRKSPKGRMIHVRLDDETHRRLKIYAAQASATIQQLVEDLIHQKLIKSSGRDVQS